MEDSSIEDLIKGIQELNLNLKVVRVEGLIVTSIQKHLEPRQELCIWCDDPSHKCKDCDDFNDAFKNNVVF